MLSDMADFILTSRSVAEGEPIGGRHSCDGADLSPAMGWEGAPEGTAAFALIVDDPDARGFRPLGDLRPAGRRQRLAAAGCRSVRAVSGPQRLRARRLRRTVPTVRDAPLSVHAVRAFSASAVTRDSLG